MMVYSTHVTKDGAVFIALGHVPDKFTNRESRDLAARDERQSRLAGYRARAELGLPVCEERK